MADLIRFAACAPIGKSKKIKSAFHTVGIKQDGSGTPLKKILWLAERGAGESPILPRAPEGPVAFLDSQRAVAIAPAAPSTGWAPP
jgi:hypothetical protein